MLKLRTATSVLRSARPLHIRQVSHSVRVGIPEVVQDAYDNNHLPIGVPRSKHPLGPPYTEPSKLESWPQDLYTSHVKPKGFRDGIAWSLVVFFRQFTHAFFRKKYHHHALVLETVAAVPGMVAGFHRHHTSLRRFERDYGWIGSLLEEAENERMHLLIWMQYTQPEWHERLLVLLAQAVYVPAYSVLYAVSPVTAHRFVGYLEEEACNAYTDFLHAVTHGDLPNGPAPTIAKNYYNLPPTATIRDVILCVRADEAMHRDANHHFAELSKLPRGTLAAKATSPDVKTSGPQ